MLTRSKEDIRAVDTPVAGILVAGIPQEACTTLDQAVVVAVVVAVAIMDAAGADTMVAAAAARLLMRCLMPSTCQSLAIRN